MSRNGKACKLKRALQKDPCRATTLSNVKFLQDLLPDTTKTSEGNVVFLITSHENQEKVQEIGCDSFHLLAHGCFVSWTRHCLYVDPIVKPKLEQKLLLYNRSLPFWRIAMRDSVKPQYYFESAIVQISLKA